MILKQGKLRGDKTKYVDGIGYCIWYPFSTDDPEEENTGLCFDISENDIDDAIDLLKRLKDEKAEVVK